MGKTTAILGLLLFGVGIILIVISVHRAKRIAHFLKENYPEQWKNLGKPIPGYFQSSRRRRWFEFIQQQKYVDFDDSKLVEMCDHQRKLERLILAYIIAFIAGFGGLVMWFKLSGFVLKV